jgi:hypothetical protein
VPGHHNKANATIIATSREVLDATSARLARFPFAISTGIEPPACAAAVVARWNDCFLTDCHEISTERRHTPSRGAVPWGTAPIILALIEGDSSWNALRDFRRAPLRARC